MFDVLLCNLQRLLVFTEGRCAIQLIFRFSCSSFYINRLCYNDCCGGCSLTKNEHVCGMSYTHSHFHRAAYVRKCLNLNFISTAASQASQQPQERRKAVNNTSTALNTVPLNNVNTNIVCRGYSLLKKEICHCRQHLYSVV